MKKVLLCLLIVLAGCSTNRYHKLVEQDTREMAAYQQASAEVITKLKAGQIGAAEATEKMSANARANVPNDPAFHEMIDAVGEVLKQAEQGKISEAAGSQQTDAIRARYRDAKAQQYQAAAQSDASDKRWLGGFVNSMDAWKDLFNIFNM